jgi:hypothetical protein
VPPPRSVECPIHVIHGQKVMLDRYMAALYGVCTGAFNQPVRRNLDRSPEDFMFQLTGKEAENLKSQSVTSGWGGRRKREARQNVAELFNVIRSTGRCSLRNHKHEGARIKAHG